MKPMPNRDIFFFLNYMSHNQMIIYGSYGKNHSSLEVNMHSSMFHFFIFKYLTLFLCISKIQFKAFIIKLANISNLLKMTMAKYNSIKLCDMLKGQKLTKFRIFLFASIQNVLPSTFGDLLKNVCICFAALIVEYLSINPSNSSYIKPKCSLMVEDLFRLLIKYY